MAEPLYGTGDAPVRANVAGTVRELSLRVDTTSESSLNETHVPVPLVLWPRRGAGMFVADDRPGALDLGAASSTRVTATLTLPVRGTYRVYLYKAFTPLDLVRTYVALTAKPAVPPRWAFAPQQWRNVWNSTAEILDDMTQMLFSGVFDRFPELQMCWIETGVGWLPHMLEAIDDRYWRNRSWGALSMKHPPSHYWRTNNAASFISDRSGIALRHAVGVENMMWSSDYPHHGNDWPYSRKVN